MSEDWIPARTIHPSTKGNRGIISTQKNPLSFVEYESCVERDFLLQAIHCPSVKSILHQPEKIPFLDSHGAKKQYTPDVLVETNDGTRRLIEIKPEEELLNNKAKYEERWSYARNYAENAGLIFIVITDKQIRTPRWFNIWFTLGASKCTQNDEYMDKLVRVIPLEGDEYNSLCYKIASGFGVPPTKAAQMLCYAIYHGYVLVPDFSTKVLAKKTSILPVQDKLIAPFRPLFDDLNVPEYGSLDFQESLSMDETKDIDSKDILEMVDNATISNELLQKREEMILAWKRQPQNKKTEQWLDNFYKTWNISKSQFYRYLARYNAGGRTELLPKHGNAGRKPAYDENVTALLDIAKGLYFQPRGTLKVAFKQLVQSCAENNIQAPSETTFKRYLYKNASKFDFAKKKGQKYVKAHFTPSLKSFQGAIMPLQIIQIDNSQCDVFSTDEETRTPLTVPNITAAIDCYTGFITGLNVSLFACSHRSIIEVLVQTILSKQRYVERFQAQHEWPIQGFPVLILVDNGMDFRSHELRDFCIKHDIILEFVPIHTPQYKAYIEQWFNSLKQAMKPDMPGFRPTLKERIENPDLKPEREATLTPQEIETWIYNWVIDEYHFANKDGGYVLAPYLKYEDVLKGNTDLIFPSARDTPTKPREIDDLTLAILHDESHGLKDYGIQWKNLLYNNTQLGEIHKFVGNAKVKVLRDSRDIRFIWVVDPVTNTPIFIGLGSGWAATLAETFGDMPVSEATWLSTLKKLRMQSKERLTAHQFASIISRQQRDDLVEASKKALKTKRKEIEKAKETARKDIRDRVSLPSKNNIQEAPEEPDQNLSLNAEDVADPEPETPKEDKLQKKIDWSKVKKLPTDTFYRGR